MPHKLRPFGHQLKPDIHINLDTNQKTYTTLDRIEGAVTVTCPVDTPVDGLDIEFAGSSRTFVERLTTSAAASGRSEAFHQFLKLSQPGLLRQLPPDHVLKAHQTYEFPFVFAIPMQLLPRVCRHPAVADTVRDAHLRLPPTFGDKDLAGHRGALDDLAPEMASVRYGVFVKLTATKFKGEETWQSTIAAKARRVRVIPAVEEQPPLDVHVEDGEYVLRKTKLIRKTILTTRAGTLAMEAPQPRAFQLRSYGNPDSRTDTVARVTLRFDPLEPKALPPKLGNLTSKLRVSTFFGCTARRMFPSKTNSLLDMSQGLHSETLPLSSRAMAGVEWRRHHPDEPETITRRDSATSVLSQDLVAPPEPSADYRGGVYYTASIVVPVTLPTHKAFPPTFHSCLISRVYALKFDLSLTKAALVTSLSLKVPVQVSSEGLVGDEFGRSGSVDYSVETDIDGEDVTSFFEPRVVHPPSEGYVERSRIGSVAPMGDDPPGYSPQAAGFTATYTGTSGGFVTSSRSVSVSVH